MPTVTLTDRFIKSVKLPASGQEDHWDQATPGLSLRITDRGRKSWTVMYRIDGRQERRTLGTYPAVTLKAARQRAGDVRDLVSAGKSPKLEQELRRREEQQARADTLAAVARRYLQSIGAEPVEQAPTGKGRTRRGRVLRTAKEYKRTLEKYVVPTLGTRPIRDVNRRDLVELLNDIADNHGGVMANRTLSKIRTMFDWAMSQDIVIGSPCAGIKPPADETPRTRTLSDEEIRRIWRACDQVGYPYGRCVQLLLLTGVRRSEAAEMTREEVDGAVWIVPARRQKSNVDHAVALLPMAAQIIADAPNMGPYVFASSVTGGAMSAFSDRRAELDEIINADGGPPLEHWILHDFRRVIRTAMSAMRVDHDISEKVLGHVPKGLRKIYDRHSYFEEKKAALQLWEQRLRSILNPDASKNEDALRAA